MYTVIWGLLTLFQPTLSIPNVYSNMGFVNIVSTNYFQYQMYTVIWDLLTLFQPTLSIPNVYSNMGFVNIVSTNTFNTKCIQ